MGREEMTWLKWTVCRGTEDGNGEWAQTRKILECQDWAFPLHHKGGRDVLKVCKQETVYWGNDQGNVEFKALKI